LGVYSFFFKLETLLSVLAQGFIAGLVAVLINITVLVLLENKEIETVLKTLKRRFWKKQVINPGTDVI
jgi:hypothetical protein